jgi:hypothetical protein
MEKDLRHLRILGTANYVFAGITGAIFILPLIYFNLAFLMLYISSLSLGMSWYVQGTPDFSSLRDGKGPGFMIIVFPLVFGSIFGVILLASTIATYYCGRSLRTQKNYVFCLVMAALSATSFPFGTILGIFSLVVLLRDSVKTLFDKDRAKEIYE